MGPTVDPRLQKWVGHDEMGMMDPGEQSIQGWFGGMVPYFAWDQHPTPPRWPFADPDRTTLMTRAMHPTLLLLHGFPLDHTLWASNIPALSAMAEVIAPDLRGFGQYRATDEVTTMEAYASDLFRILDERGVQRVIPCGLSMGGYIAMAMAEQQPARVAGLILCNTRSIADTAEAREGRRTTAHDARTKGMAVLARAMAPKLLGASTRRTRPDRLPRIEAMIARQRPEATAAASLGMAERPDRTHILRHFEKPALVITGDEDELMPLTTSVSMAHALPQGRLVVIEQAGHLSNTERPEVFNATVTDFLGKNFSQPG